MVSSIDQQLPRVSIIIVHPYGFEHTPRCLDSLRTMTYPNAEVIIVDNGSQDGSGEMLRKHYPEVTFIHNEKNDGFAGGNNIGIEYALANGAQYVLLLNNDTIVTPGFLEPLAERLGSNKEIGAVSGKIYYYPDAVGGKDKIIWYAGARQKWHMAYNHTCEFEQDNGQCDEAGEVAYASGCLMLLRGDVLKQIGGLSEEYFMYWEESDWCMRAKAIGYSSWYEPRAVIYHNTRSSIKGKETPLYTYMMYRNFPIFASHHFHGLRRIWFWLCYPLHIINRLGVCLKAKNWPAAIAILSGVGDYLRGYKGKEGIKERGLVN